MSHSRNDYLRSSPSNEADTCSAKKAFRRGERQQNKKQVSGELSAMYEARKQCKALESTFQKKIGKHGISYPTRTECKCL